MATSRIKALSLYKSILRAHDRYLPQAMRQLGDAYVKSEFRLHKTAKEEQTTQFFHEWTNYLQHIEQTGREQSSREVGLMDSNSNSNSNTITPATTAMMNNNNNESSKRSSFGRNINQGVEFNEEQVNQLDKLREEAVKAGGKKGGVGSGGVIVDRYDGR